MSADPDVPIEHTRYSGGHVMKTVWYTKNRDGTYEAASVWKNDLKAREWNQWLIPPSVENMHPKHPCFDLNAAVLKCSDSQPEMMKLGGRCAVCHVERKELMVCLAQKKGWKPPRQEEKAWYQFW
jgi:hypothetical protein